jgi:3,4-dihydroxy 2-butanone 4-phosphate synthase/GTP cyclohydrolase II
MILKEIFLNEESKSPPVNGKSVMSCEHRIKRLASAKLPSIYDGTFTATVYESNLDNSAHIALIKGTIRSDREILVRIHSECLTGDVFGSMRCDCGEQLHQALRTISKEGEGVLIYVRQEGRGIGLANKLRAYALQDKGFDTVEANSKLGFEPDLRDYSICAQILTNLGIKKVRLMTNNPGKLIGLRRYGVQVVERIPIEMEPQDTNIRYLKTKKAKLGHLLDKV